MYLKRRDFIQQLTFAGTAAMIPSTIFGGAFSQPKPQEKIWASLLHLSFNFASGVQVGNFGGFKTYFDLSDELWDDAIKLMAAKGINLVLINLDDYILWKSHPEIAVRDAWSKSKLQEKLSQIRNLGIEPIPMLNFSTTHDAWLKEYARMVSTSKYYQVCSDLIAEAVDLFDKPRFFHLGMDEEAFHYQESRYDYIVIRQGDLWWNDLYFLIGEVEKRGVRPWVWSDYIWGQKEIFFKKMPKSVLQSNWYYGNQFDTSKMKEDLKKRYVDAYLELHEKGYDQIPTGSSLHFEENQLDTVKFCVKKGIDDESLLGYMQTSWRPTREEYRENIMESIRTEKMAIEWWKSIVNNK